VAYSSDDDAGDGKEEEKENVSIYLFEHFFFITYLLTLILFQDEQDDDDWLVVPDDDDDIQLPPRLLHSTRLFIYSKGMAYVEIGLLPSSDGYGNATCRTTIIIYYHGEWIAFDKEQLSEFFVIVREIGNYHDYKEFGHRAYFDRSQDPLIGSIKIEMIENFFNIKFTSSEGEEYVINQFMVDDMRHLLRMELPISAKILNTNIGCDDVNKKIEDMAVQCSHNTEEIVKLTEIWGCDGFVFDLAMNHFPFFDQFVCEKIRNN
jgi:hypothetical protein